MPSAKKSTGKSAPPDLPEDLSHKEYKDELYRLQVELVKLQRDIIAENRKLLVGNFSSSSKGATPRARTAS